MKRVAVLIPITVGVGMLSLLSFMLFHIVKQERPCEERWSSSGWQTSGGDSITVAYPYTVPDELIYDEEQKELNEYFSLVNQHFFDNALPKEIRVVVKADANTYEYGSWDAENRIYINAAKLKGMRSMKMTLLHEMAHVAVIAMHGTENGSHDYKFQKEMLRLARAGAMEGLW